MTTLSSEAVVIERAQPLFLRGGGEAGALIRSIDWAQTVLGPPESWPAVLKTTLSTMLHSRHPMFLWWGPELIQFYNDAYVPSFGKGKHPRAMGQRGADCWPEIWAIIGPQIRDVMERGIASWHENQLVPIFRDGGIRDVYWTYGYSPVFDENHERIAGTLVVCQETTAQVLSHAAVHEANRESEASRMRLINLFDNAPAFVCTLAGPQHVFEMVNPLYQQLVGANRHVLGRAVAKALPEVVPQGFIDLLDRVYREDEPFIGRETLVRLAASDSGKLEERFVTFVYQPRHDARAQVEGIDVFGFDVTDGVLARAAAQRAHETSVALAESIPQQVWSADRSGGLSFVNQRVLDYFGVAEEQVLHGGWTQFVHPDDVQQTLQAWKQSLATSELYENEFRLRSKKGEYRWHLARALPVRDGQGDMTRWFGTNTDIDEQKRLRERFRAQAEFEKHLLGIVSHDLRTPLSVIALGTTVLADQQSLSPAAAQTLLRIQSATRRALRMVSDLLDFTQARLGGGLQIQPRSMQLCDVVESVLQEFLVTHSDRRIRYEQDGDGGGTWDPDRIAQLLVNLITNAIHYGHPAEPVVVKHEADREYVVLSVTNQGKPIPAEMLPMLFAPMQRGSKSSTERSVGLGLYIVDEIAKRHGGSVSVRSSEGAGTTFAVRLPRHSRSADPEAFDEHHGA